MPSIKLLVSLAVIAPVKLLAPRYEQTTGISVDTVFAPTEVLKSNLKDGEYADAVIMTSKAIHDLIDERVVIASSDIALASTSVGIAVRHGAAKPDLSTFASFKKAFDDVPSIAISDAGASGIHFRQIAAKFGMLDALMQKARTIPQGFTAELAADGRAEWAIQQLSELAVVEGVEIVGPLPDEIGSTTVFTGGVLAASKAAEKARAFLEFLRRPEHNQILLKAGLRLP